MHKLFRLWRRSESDQELDTELAFHLQELKDEHLLAGMTEQEALRLAYLKLGNMQGVRERYRRISWFTPFEDASRDLSFAFRSLSKARGLHVMAALALALGIGCSTIVFSVVYNGVLHPFPYRGADRLTAIRLDDAHVTDRGLRYDFRLDEIDALRKNNRSFEDFVGYANWYTNYSHERTSQALHGAALTPNAMEFFGIQPLLGRGIREQDSQAGAAPVVLLSYQFWETQFGGEPSVLGRQMVLDGRTRTIIGVMPRRFGIAGADLWMPVPWNPDHAVEENEPRYFWTSAIIRRGVSLQAAAADLAVVFRRLARVYPEDYAAEFTVKVAPLSDTVVADFKWTLLLLATSVVLLLLVSCSNAATLLMVRASARAREMAMRATLGASRGRLVRQLLVETLVLAGGACAAGCFIAYLGLKGATAMLIRPFTQIPCEASISLNWSALVFAMSTSLVVSLFAAIAPAVYSVRRDLQKQLRSAGAGINATFHGGRFRSSLVVCQVGFSVVLLVYAGLAVRSFVAITHADLGLRAENLFIGWLHYPRGTYPTVEKKRDYITLLLRRLAALPGVISVAESVGRPVAGGPFSDVTIAGRPHAECWRGIINPCSEQYFSTLGIQLLRGRVLSADDIGSGRFVAVINQTMARRYFAGQDPIGQRMRFDELDSIAAAPHNAWFEVIGVVSDFRNQGIAQPPMPEAFVPHSFSGFGDRGILVRTSLDSASIQHQVQRVLWEIDPQVMLFEPSTLKNFLSQEYYAKPRFSLITMSACALLGLMLSMIGIFSLMAYTVSLLTHEVGVRMALGARRSTILSMILKRGARLVGAGVVLGVSVSLPIASVLHRQLQGVPSLDSFSVIAATLLLFSAGMLASYVPALRATRVDPNTALRYE